MSKLKGLPPIHCVSLEESVSRRNNLENWFEKYNITNYTPHLFHRYQEGDCELVGPLAHMLALGSKGPITSHFKLLKNWYRYADEPYALIIEDDLSLETVEYWNFTWEEFFDNLPENWNCIQLSLIREYECEQYHFEIRRDKDWSAAAYLIKRDYVKFLLDRYYPDDIFTLDIKEYNCIPVIEQLLFLSPIGGVYSFPLFVEDCENTKSTFVNDYANENGQGSFHHSSYRNTIRWWKSIGNKLTIQDIMKGKINHIYQEPQFGENWFSYPNLYSEMVKKFPSGSKFVEIGSWKGKSSSFMSVEIANSYKDIDFYCVDTWEGSVEHKGEYDLETLYETFISNMKPLENYYTPVRMTSLEAAKQFEDNSLDFVFIDASHEYEDVKNDIIAWLPKVKSGGVLAGHDYYIEYDYFPGVKQAVNECFNQNEIILNEDCWAYNVDRSNYKMDKLTDFSLDTENAEKNYNLARWYENQGHTAPAHTFYLRAAERAENTDLAYQALIRASFCYRSQGSRDATEKVLLENALNLNPKRPEAYYYLSLFYERKQEWQNCYTYANLGLQCYENKFEHIDVPEYEGKQLLIFQKAVSSWWWGKGQECRDLFLHLIDNYWDVLNDTHKKSVENNISRLGITPYSQSQVLYTKDKHNQLRYKFKDCETIEKNYSQVYQDMFVLSMLDGKKNGTFLEIGGAKPFERNNTALLEQNYGWSGVSIELNDKFVSEYRNQRPNVNVIHQDALTVNYESILEENFNSNIIDYLQMDIEPAKNTYECMLKIPFDKYKFAVITYEHDYYIDTTKSYRNKSREFLRSKGYVLVVNDISPEGKSTFEDWWVHPDLIDEKILNIMTDVSDDIKKVDDYMLFSKNFIEIKEKEFDFRISKNSKSTSWIVDNFYENPDEIRKFALEQDYLEGGIGRGFIGRRTHKQFLFPGLKERFEEIMGRKITTWEEHGMNGRFQISWSGEPLVYHCDSQKWGGMLYLTPNAPYQCGTTLYANKKTRARTYHDNGWDDAWVGIPGDCHLDGTHFEPVDVLGNVYNRLVIFDASCIHSASQYFGTVKENGRLWQMFFFDTD